MNDHPSYVRPLIPVFNDDLDVFKRSHMEGVRCPGLVSIHAFAFVYGPDTELGDGTVVGPFVEIQKGVKVGKNCKIQSHSFVCEGVELEDWVFVGHGVTFTNDRYPRISGNWELERTIVRRGASIGSGATILPGVEIGADAMVGAGAVVTKNVEAGATVAGNPARPVV